MNASTPAGRRDILIGFTAVAASQFALGLYATALNELFYARFGPFYDSMAYADALAQMASSVGSQGRMAALLDRIRNSTVAYPWILFAPLAGIIPLHRAIGTWIQIATAGAMQFVLFHYFLRVRRTSLLEALAYSSAFVLLAAAFNFNGGLADFRMDLLQYLLFATTMAVYLTARQSAGFGWWIALGASAGILCLARATSPVYLAPIFALLAAADIFSGRIRWRAVLLRWIVTVGVATLVSGWFYALNFGRLFFYYVIWNQDANANLPLSTSVTHLEFAQRHVGGYLVLALAVVAATAFTLAIATDCRAAFGRLNWRPLLFSAVPLAYLVLSGAGLNPFVSIVGVAGIVMFLVDPIDGERPPWPRAASAIAVIALLAAGLANAASGIRNHRNEDVVSSWIPRQQGLRQMAEAIVGAARADGISRVYSYAMIHIGSVSRESIFNTLIYDHRFPPIGLNVGVGKAQLAAAPGRYGVATQIEWNALGTDDEARIVEVVVRLQESADFAIIPTADSKLPAHVHVTAFIPEITRRILASGQWTPLTGPIQVSPTEGIVVLRNNRRMAAGQP